jgi:hypothetical protein
MSLFVSAAGGGESIAAVLSNVVWSALGSRVACEMEGRVGSEEEPVGGRGEVVAMPAIVLDDVCV